MNRVIETLEACSTVSEVIVSCYNKTVRSNSSPSIFRIVKRTDATNIIPGLHKQETILIVKPVPTIDFDRCRPERCENGICKVIIACPHRVFIQEEPYEFPMHDSYSCEGCGACVEACPLAAVRMV